MPVTCPSPDFFDKVQWFTLVTAPQLWIYFRMEHPQHPNNEAASLADHISTFLTQHISPHHALTRLMYILTRVSYKPWKNWQIRWFIKRYQVDMSIAREPDPFIHPDFNTFFTRALKTGARQVVNGSHNIACPVDGAVSQAGAICDGRIFQAKGQDYSLESLLGGSAERAEAFMGGTFATLYLSPRDYHRIHMPLTGRLIETVYIPGRLFSVNPRTTRCVPGLFARNERLVAIFDTAAGPMALILVGAMFVAGIETVWTGPIHQHTHDVQATARMAEGRAMQEQLPRRTSVAGGRMPGAPNTLKTWDNRADNVTLQHGAEMGRFNMGSTVIVLFGTRSGVELATSIQPAAPVQMGQLLGRYR